MQLIITQRFFTILPNLLLLILCYGLNSIDSQRTQLPNITEPVLIVVSFDAFKEDYLFRNVTPVMNKLREQGVTTDYMRNVFPTKTFVNHHSIATGLYPGIHGVLANRLYDSKQGELGYGYELFHYNEKIMPIWALNEKYGKHSGCMMWPGSDFQYNGYQCTNHQSFNASVNWIERVDTIISWIKQPINSTNLIMLYFEEPDYTGHMYGPDSEEITSIVHKLDTITGYLHEQLKKHNLLDIVNVLHISDHGMEGVASPNFINLTDFLINGTYKMYGSSPILQIVPTEIGNATDIYHRLLNASNIHNNTFNVYNESTLPERWYCNNERRLNPILAVAKHGYGFQDMYTSAKYYEENFNVTFTPTHKYGIHGYDNEYESMHAIFFANGPVFKSNHTIKPFDSIDLYSLFCKILNIKPEPNNGTFVNVMDAIRMNNDQQILSNAMPDQWDQTFIGRFTIAVALSFSIILLATLIYLTKRRTKLFQRIKINSSNKLNEATMEGEKLLDDSDWEKC